MNRNSFVVFAILVALYITTLLQAGIVGGVATTNPLEKEITSSGGVEFVVSFQEGSKLHVAYSNPTNEEAKFEGYVITVDRQRVFEDEFNLSQGEHRTETINITPGINVNQDEHTVTFSTFGGHAQFNFTREIEAVDSGRIPTPYIADVNVTSGTVKGEPSAVANVTIVNPSKQLYSTKLFVHTSDTDGSLYPASVRPGDSRTITVELLDERGSKIAGEARLYTGNLTTEDGAMDQVGFAGQAGEGTQVWNDSYEPVRPTWMNDHYQYSNDSYGRSLGEKVSGGREVGGIPLVYLGVALLVGWFGLQKFR